MEKRKHGIILMFVGGLVLTASLFTNSWQTYRLSSDDVFAGQARQEIRLGLRSASFTSCDKKECRSGSVDYQMKMFRKTGGKIWFVSAQVTFWAGLVTTLCLIIGAALLWTNHYHGHTFMNLSLAGTVLVIVTAAFCAKGAGLGHVQGFSRAGILGLGYSYVIFTAGATAALFGVRWVWRGTLAVEEESWFGEGEGDGPGFGEGEGADSDDDGPGAAV